MGNTIIGSPLSQELAHPEGLGEPGLYLCPQEGEVSPCAKADPFGIAPSGDLARRRYYSSSLEKSLGLGAKGAI